MIYNFNIGGEMEVQEFNLGKIRKFYEKENNIKGLNCLVARVIDNLINKGIDANFDFAFFKNLEINPYLLKEYEDNPSKNFEELLYNLVIYGAKDQEQIRNMALRKCKWPYLIKLVNNGFIALEDYEKQLIASLPYCSYDAIFKVNGLNVAKIKRIIADALYEENISFGYYMLMALFIVNTEYDKNNLEFAKRIVAYPGNDLNYLLLEILRLYLKEKYNENMENLDRIMLENYEQMVSFRPDILLIYLTFRNRLLHKDSTMKSIYDNDLWEEKRKDILKKIGAGTEKKVAFYINEEVISKLDFPYIIDCWLANGNSLAISTYLNFFLDRDFAYNDVGEKLDQEYITKSNEKGYKRKKVK